MNENNIYTPVSVGNWIITLIISSIPLVNVVMLLIWAFSKNTHPSKANLAKAFLIVFAIALVFYLAMLFTMGIMLANEPY